MPAASGTSLGCRSRISMESKILRGGGQLSHPRIAAASSAVTVGAVRTVAGASCHGLRAADADQNSKDDGETAISPENQALRTAW